MEGRRFSLGLAAGLLLGVAIITASGGLGALSAGVFPASKSLQGGLSTVTYTAVGTVLTSTASSAVTTSQSADLAVANATKPSTVTSQTTPGYSSNSYLTNLNSGTTAPAYSSRVESIAHQPLITDAVVFIPVLVAFLLGAILYRASDRNSEQPSEERA